MFALVVLIVLIFLEEDSANNLIGLYGVDCSVFCPTLLVQCGQAFSFLTIFCEKALSYGSYINIRIKANNRNNDRQSIFFMRVLIFELTETYKSIYVS